MGINLKNHLYYLTIKYLLLKNYQYYFYIKNYLQKLDYKNL